MSCRRAQAIFQAENDRGGIAWASFCLGFVLLWHGNPVEAEAVICAALALAIQNHFHSDVDILIDSMRSDTQRTFDQNRSNRALC